MDEMLKENYMRMIDLMQSQMKTLTNMVSLLLEIIEDHEADMVKMAEKINELESRIS